MSDSYNTEHHPEWYRDIPEMKTLILGSFPPHQRMWTYPFYYPNHQNRFWKILADLAEVELTVFSRKEKTKQLEQHAVEERYLIMKKLKTGVQNLGKTIQRKDKSSRDTDIRITAYQDIISIILKHPELEKILLPGFSAANSTYSAFICYLKQKGIDVDENKKPYAGYEFQIKINDRKIRCVVLNSTSTATKIPYKMVLKQFRDNIL